MPDGQHDRHAESARIINKYIISTEHYCFWVCRILFLTIYPDQARSCVSRQSAFINIVQNLSDIDNGKCYRRSPHIS